MTRTRRDADWFCRRPRAPKSYCRTAVGRLLAVHVTHSQTALPAETQRFLCAARVQQRTVRFLIGRPRCAPACSTMMQTCRPPGQHVEPYSFRCNIISLLDLIFRLILFYSYSYSIVIFVSYVVTVSNQQPYRSSLLFYSSHSVVEVRTRLLTAETAFCLFVDLFVDMSTLVVK